MTISFEFFYMRLLKFEWLLLFTLVNLLSSKDDIEKMKAKVMVITTIVF